MGAVDMFSSEIQDIMCRFIEECPAVTLAELKDRVQQSGLASNVKIAFCSAFEALEVLLPPQIEIKPMPIPDLGVAATLLIEKVIARPGLVPTTTTTLRPTEVEKPLVGALVPEPVAVQKKLMSKLKSRSYSVFNRVFHSGFLKPFQA